MPGRRTGLCEVWLVGPGARSCGGSEGVRTLESVLRDFRRGLGDGGESSGWVTWPWTDRYWACHLIPRGVGFLICEVEWLGEEERS